MTEFGSSQQEDHFLVELKPHIDVRTTTDVSITPNNIAAKSSEAVRKAMESVKEIVGRVVETIHEIPILDLPDEIEVKFGLKLTTDANAFILNAGAEAHFTVKMKWSSKSDIK